MTKRERRDGDQMPNMDNQFYFARLAFGGGPKETLGRFYSFLDGNRPYDDSEAFIAGWQIAMQSYEADENLLAISPTNKSIAMRLNNESFFFTKPATLHLTHNDTETKHVFDYVFQALHTTHRTPEAFSTAAEALFGFILYHEARLIYQDYQLSIEAKGIPYKPETYDLVLTFTNMPKNLVSSEG